MLSTSYKLTVYIEATPLLDKKPTGIGIVISQIVNSLFLNKDEKLDIYLLVKLSKYIKNPKSSKFPTIYYEDPFLPLLSISKPHIIHSLSSYMPFFPFSKKILTIHDIFTYNKTYSSKSFRKRMNKKLIKSIKRTDYIHTSSNFVKTEIIKDLKFPPDKIFTIPFGGNHILQETILPFKEIKQTYNLPDEYILYIGTIEKRKNLINIGRALKDTNINVVVIGGTGYKGELIKNKVCKLKNFFCIGYLNRHHIASIYRYAKALIFPSLDEGFGMPIVEAMHIGVPIITSARGAIPEIAKDAAIYVKPHDPKDIRNKTIKLLSDQKLQRELIVKGFKLSENYKWDFFSKKLIDTYFFLAQNSS